MMGRHLGLLLGLALLASAATRAVGAPLDARALILGLAREPPASVEFAEARFSPLLREPLIVSGELVYTGPSRLERRVMRPYVETTSILGESVRIEREGDRPRSFALKRAPELRGFLNAFSGLLAGDAAALEKDFAIAASGEDGLWELVLTPRGEGIRRVEAIVVSGGRDGPRCLATYDTEGGGSIMVLGATMEPISPVASLDDLTARCRAE